MTVPQAISISGAASLPKTTRMLVLVLLAALGCQPESSGPNLLLISIDTARQDHFSAYGYRRNTTPNIRTLARAGVRLDAAYAPTATTGQPATATR